MRIISNHMPKAGGLTLRGHLEHIYGKAVIHDYTPCGHPDYQDEPAPPYILKKLRHPKKTTVIHGHFLMNRYAHIPAANFICWVRDPVERLMSHYYYWLRMPDYDHPYCLKLVEDGLSVVEFAELMPNMFTRRFAPLSIDDFTFVGLTERYAESLRLFYAMFCPEKRVKNELHENKNFARDKKAYRLSDEKRAKVKAINNQDMALYARAKDKFDDLRERHKDGF